MLVRLEAPRDFSFRSILASHGWCELAPFALDAATGALSTIVPLEGGGARRVVLTARTRTVEVESPGSIEAATRRTLVAAARRMLALDVHLGEFHKSVRRDARYRWIASSRSGRFLRSPTAFEDVVKLVLTTNCSWAFTKKMTAALVACYGESTADGARSFPTAERLATVRERELREVVRAGYRAPYLVQLARAVADGSADPASWDDDPREADELKKEILRLPGVGPYVAENLLKFLGKPHGLALDSSMRARYAEMYHGGRKIKDRTIERRMAPLGRWAGLALWFDLFRGWEPDALP